MPVDAAVADAQWRRFQFVRDQGHLDFIAKAEKCDRFFMGDQWLQTDLNALTLSRRPAITINKIIGVCGTLLGEQIQNRTEVLYRPANGSSADTADALSKVWMQISQENQLPWVRTDLFADGIIRSRGFYDVRMEFDDAMQGKVRIELINSKNVLIDPDAEEYDPDKWNDIFITKWLTYQDVSTLYNEADAEYLKDRGESAYPYGYDSIERVRDRFSGQISLGGAYGLPDNEVRRNIRVLERQHRKLDKQLHFVDTQTGDMRPVPEDWDRNRIAALLEKSSGRLTTLKKLVKRIRWTVTADNVVLHDEWSPYKHFTVVPFFPNFRYGRTIGIVENLLGSQEILNKVSSQELHIVNTTANSGWTVEEQSLVNMTTSELEVSGAKTGLVIEYKKGSTPPEKITPNQTPTGLDRVSFKAEEHIKSISGVSDSMQGFDREDVAAKAIAYKRQNGSVNMAKIVDNLERTDWILARNVTDLVQQYYTEERIVTITHADVTHEPETMTVNQYDPATEQIVNDLTLGEYELVITSTPYRSSLEDSQFDQAMAMREQGIKIPDSVVIENSRLLRRADILKKMEAEQNSPAAQKTAQLQEQELQAQVQLTQASAQQKGADAQLKQTKSQVEAQGEPQKDPAQEHALEQYKLEQEFALRRQESDREFTLKQQAADRDFELKKQAADRDAALAADKAAHERAQSLRQTVTQPA